MSDFAQMMERAAALEAKLAQAAELVGHVGEELADHPVVEALQELLAEFAPKAGAAE